VAEECRLQGAEAEMEAFDLRDTGALLNRLAALDERQPIGLAIFNAGVGGSVSSERLAEDPLDAVLMAGVNFTAPVAGATLLAGRMAQRGMGQIVLIGSMAGAFPLPMAPTYSGTKAGLTRFAGALALRMRKHGVAVTLVSPGFVDTPMSRSVREPKPFLISAEAAAAIITRKIARRSRHVVLPWQFAVIQALSWLAPRALTDAILSRM
jgi:short-subunit dehydrogenase